MDRASAARLAGMDRQTLRDWVHRNNAEGIAGLCNRPAQGRKPKLTEGQMAALKAVVLAGPDPAVDKITRWRIVDLCRWVKGRWDLSNTGMCSVDADTRGFHTRCAANNLPQIVRFRPSNAMLGSGQTTPQDYPE
jgi:homeodomain-containing protein